MLLHTLSKSGCADARNKIAVILILPMGRSLKRFAKTYISHKHSVHDIIMNPVNTSVLSTLYLERKV